MVQQLVTTIQALTTATTAPPAAQAAPVPPAHASPYKGDALDLSSCRGTRLFHDGCMVLSSKFTGKVEDLHLFLADLHNHTQTCQWSATAHGILSIIVGTTMFNLLDDYSKLSATQVETLHLVQAAGVDL